MSFTGLAFYYLSICLEGGLFGIYSGLFAIHLALHATKRETDSSKPKIIFYSLCVLYVLTGAVFAFDIANAASSIQDVTVVYSLGITENTLFGCCDFIAQCILIHRCWIVYGQKIRVIIVPSILALAYLVMWVAANGAYYYYTVPNGIGELVWGARLVLTSLITSMTVNGLVTGLIVFKIFKVLREVKSVTTVEDKSLGITPGNKLHSVIFIIIESGMALFVSQLARVVITPLFTVTAAADDAFELIVAIHEMVNGIAPTIILVRVSLGLSFHDKESLEEAVGSLQFVANPIPEAGSIDQDRSLHIGHEDLPVMGNINQERRDDDGSDDIQIVDR